MKRVMLAVLGLFFAANLCMAQTWQGRVLRGTATQEMQAPGLSAAHSSLPLGSKVKVTNPANGLEIEATIIQQIPETYNRLIDLSPSAAAALGLGSGGPVLVTTLGLPPSISVVPAASATISPPSGQKTDAELPDADKLPFNVIINNYILPDNLAGEEESPVQTGNSVPTAPQTPPVTAPVPAQPPVSAPPPVPVAPVMPAAPPPAPPVYAVPAPPALVYPQVYSPIYTAPPVSNIQIMPSLPNPNTDKMYRLLVGTYQGLDSAFVVCQQLQAAGFDVLQEQAGEMCRVYAAGVPASRVYYACQRLGAIGFQQVWIHE